MALGNLQELIPAIFTGPNGERLTPEQIAQRQEIAQSLVARATDTRPDAGGIASVLTKGLLGFQSGRNNRTADAAIKANATASEANMSAMLGSLGLGGGNAYPAAVASGASPTSSVATNTVPANFNIGENQGAIRQGIIEAAQAIGADPLDLATAISYETGGTFSPTKAGPTTQYGQHRGLIQFGEPQAKQHGVNWDDPIGSQLGANGAIANYFRSSGFKPGMSGLDLYSTINAGRPGRYNASDAANGGAPGSVADKWNNQMTGHRSKAQALLGLEPSASPQQNMPYAPQPVSGNTAQNMPYSPTGAPLDGVLTPMAAINQVSPQNGENLFAPGADVSPADLAFAQQATGNPVVESGQITPATFDARFTGLPEQAAPMQQPAQSSQVPQQAGIDPRLAQLNDMALGGALSESGGSPVAQALAGYFPDAPSANRAPIIPQQGAGQMPMQQAATQTAPQSQMGGINPAVIQALSSPYATAQEKQIAGLLLNKQMEQQASAQAQQQEMQRRQQVAQAAGINPMYANDPELWKEAAKNAFKTPDRTSDIQNYEYAKNNGYGGSFADYQQEVKRAGATNVDARQMGSIPAGYKVDYNEMGQPISMSPIAGSPDALKMEQAKLAKDASLENKDNTANIVSQDIDRALKVIDSSNLPTTGAAGSWLSSIGGTAANDLKNLITTVQANAGFDKLQAMRDASTTGGALGAISERELTYLQSTIGSLEQSQSKDQLRYNLNRVKQAYSDIINGPKKIDARNDPLSNSKRIQDMSDDELRALANGN